GLGQTFTVGPDGTTDTTPAPPPPRHPKTNTIVLTPQHHPCPDRPPTRTDTGPTGTSPPPQNP
ncbi:MAG: hypothetical protein FWF43_01175, partial [Propionibacteriaceae bacterium]|nr:hypothetical protein [Propionibacteriaceae bacterium]